MREKVNRLVHLPDKANSAAFACIGPQPNESEPNQPNHTRRTSHASRRSLPLQERSCHYKPGGKGGSSDSTAAPMNPPRLRLLLPALFTLAAGFLVSSCTAADADADDHPSTRVESERSKRCQKRNHNQGGIECWGPCDVTGLHRTWHLEKLEEFWRIIGGPVASASERARSKNALLVPYDEVARNYSTTLANVMNHPQRTTLGAKRSSSWAGLTVSKGSAIIDSRDWQGCEAKAQWSPSTTSIV